MTRRNSTVAKPEYYTCYGAYAKEDSEEEKLYSLYNNYVGNEILDACTYRPDSINGIVDDFIYMRGLADALEDTECGSKEDLVDAVQKYCLFRVFPKFLAIRKAYLSEVKVVADFLALIELTLRNDDAAFVFAIFDDAAELDEIESLAYMSVGQMFYDTIETFDSWKRTHRIDELFNGATTSSPKEVAA